MDEPIEQTMPPRTTLARWKCPECGTTQAGFIYPDDHRTRRCQGIPRDRRTDTNARGQRICGAAMVEIHREDGAAA